MATIKEKLEMETAKMDNEIILHREGVFYIAYEHSAWLFSVALHCFKVKKVYVKCVAKEVVSIGFPMTSLEKFIPYCKLVDDGSVIRLLLYREKVPVNGDFEQWKGVQQSTISKPKPIEEHSITSAPVKVLELLKRIKEFPIECKTPLECMLFLAEIKKQMNDYI